MKITIKISILVLILAGCIDSKYYYHLLSEERWKSYSYCGGPSEMYEKDLGNSGSVLLMPDREDGSSLILSYLVKTGSTIQLLDTSIVIQKNINIEAIEIPITQFTSGMEWDHIPKEDWIEIKYYQSTEPLIGYGRFKDHSQPSLRDEWYDVKFKLSNQKLDWFRIELPDVMVDGKLIKIKPVVFEYKKGSYLACVQ